MALDRPPAHRFCQALAEETAGRRNWWVSIQKVADRMGMDIDRATVLADDCARAGYLRRATVPSPPYHPCERPSPD